jgi:hypothetical protein
MMLLRCAAFKEIRSKREFRVPVSVLNWEASQDFDYRLAGEADA